MQWVAMFFFDTWAGKVGLPYGLAMAHGRQYYDSRLTPSRHVGRMAADSLVEWLAEDQAVRHIRVARVLAARFALQVNVADVPLLAKDLLASRLANIRRDSDLQREMRSWCRGHESVLGSLA